MASTMPCAGFDASPIDVDVGRADVAPATGNPHHVQQATASEAWPLSRRRTSGCFDVTAMVVISGLLVQLSG